MGEKALHYKIILVIVLLTLVVVAIVALLIALTLLTGCEWDDSGCNHPQGCDAAAREMFQR